MLNITPTPLGLGTITTSPISNKPLVTAFLWSSTELNCLSCSGCSGASTPSLSTIRVILLLYSSYACFSSPLRITFFSAANLSTAKSPRFDNVLCMRSTDSSCAEKPLPSLPWKASINCVSLSTLKPALRIASRWFLPIILFKVLCSVTLTGWSVSESSLFAAANLATWPNKKVSFSCSTFILLA